jgi:hypothetical protein
MKKSQKPHTNVEQDDQEKKEQLPGYPIYPANQDVYAEFKEEEDTDPENIFKKKTKNYSDEKLNEKDFKQDKSGGDLDIPGAENSNKQANLANEDEENDYYSLGGDNNIDLEEDKNELGD